MAYGIAVYDTEVEAAERESGGEHKAGAEEPIWKTYVDVGLKYRWYGWLNETFFKIHSEDIPTHPCGDFEEEGFDEPDPYNKYGVDDSYGIFMRCIDDNNKYKLFGRLP